MKRDAVSLNQKLQVKNVHGKGRGVIAKFDFGVHELIEVCPVILFNVKRGENHICEEYAFRWDDRRIALALGYGSLYNHSNKPNAYYVQDTRKRTISVYALQEILKDTEIVFNYNGDPTSRKPMWFERA